MTVICPKQATVVKIQCRCQSILRIPLRVMTAERQKKDESKNLSLQTKQKHEESSVLNPLASVQVSDLRPNPPPLSCFPNPPAHQTRGSAIHVFSKHPKQKNKNYHGPNQAVLSCEWGLSSYRGCEPVLLKAELSVSTHLHVLCLPAHSPGWARAWATSQVNPQPIPPWWDKIN